MAPQLACAPRFKGKVYPLLRHNPGVCASIRALQIPVLVLRTRPQDASNPPWDPLGSATCPGLAAEFRQEQDPWLGDQTHFLPMQDPALMAQRVEGVMRTSNSASGGLSESRAAAAASLPSSRCHAHRDTMLA